MDKHIIQCAALILLVFITFSVFAQQNSISSSPSADTSDNNIQISNEPFTEGNSPTTPTLVMFIALPTFTLLYGVSTWDWGNQKSFHVNHEGFFGENTNAGGADKTGHAFSHYVAFRALHAYYDWSENGKSTKWFYSIVTASSLGLLIEVGDAYSSEYGFSYEDLVADMTGIGLGILLEYSPTLDSLIGYSWQYWPTDSYFDKFHSKPLNMTTDYNGAKFVLNFRLAGLQNLGLKLPNFLRYIQFDFGYFTRNYRSGDETDEGPYRSLYYGISLNFMEVVKDFFDNPESRTCKILQVPFKYYHIPAGYSGDYKI